MLVKILFQLKLSNSLDNSLHVFVRLVGVFFSKATKNLKIVISIMYSIV